MKSQIILLITFIYFYQLVECWQNSRAKQNKYWWAENKKIWDPKPNIVFDYQQGRRLQQQETKPETRYLNVPKNPSHSRHYPSHQRSPKSRQDNSHLCGVIPNGKAMVIGGHDARGTIPWHVALYRKNYHGTFEYGCGGTIINERTVLTAAHCLAMTDHQFKELKVEDFLVIAGKYIRDLDEKEKQKRNVAHFQIHPGYVGNTCHHNADIALIKVNRKFVFNNDVNKICINYNPDYDEYEYQHGDALIFGWGKTKLDALGHSNLQELKVPLHPREYCNNNLPFSFRAYFKDDKICAGYFNESKSVCSGDSGGGLVVNRGGQYYIIGIVSVGAAKRIQSVDTCDPNQATLYTNVNKYLGFVKLIADYWVSEL